MDFTVLIVVVVVIVGIVWYMRKDSGAGAGAGSGTGAGAGSSATKAASGAAKEKIAEDIRMTKTSRVVDEVAVLEELDETSQGFRQYCELVGTSQTSNGVTAPYSQRQVAYYNVRCLRVEDVDGRQTETLVAQENSIEAFYFTDESCDTPVYVDLATFGNNVILVNSSNHIEGPDSDFSKAFKNNSQGSVTACAARCIERASNWVSNALPRAGFALAPAPALAVAGVGAAGGAGVVMERREWKLMAPPGGGPGGPGGFGGPHGGFGGPGGPGGFGGPHGGPHGGFGGPGGMGLGGFLGGGPHGGGGGADTLVGIGLGALIGSVMAQANNSDEQTGGSNTRFCGYRLIEDVVPLASPVYCIGEIYKSGGEVHMGRSLAKDYQTSFFACKHESEVLGVLGGNR